MIACPCAPATPYTSARDLCAHLQADHLLQPGRAWMLAYALVHLRPLTHDEAVLLTTPARRPLAVAPSRAHDGPVAMPARATA